MDRSGGLHLVGSVFLAIGLVLIAIPFLLKFRTGGQSDPFAGIPPERQKILRKQVEKQQVDSPQDGDEVRLMAHLMRGRRHELMTPAGMAIFQTTMALTRGDQVFRIVAGCVVLVAVGLIFTILRQIRAGTAFLQRYPRAT
jgi:ribosomal protein L19